jgi:hypothetical protein
MAASRNPKEAEEANEARQKGTLPGTPVPSTPPPGRARSGPVPEPSVEEGASVGRAARSRAGGAAGQLTPKD